MSKPWLVGSAVLIATLLVVSIVVALTERAETLEEGTPERAVQAFLEAIEQEDYAAAYTFLSRDLTEDCTVEEFATANIRSGDAIGDRRVTLLKTTLLDGSAIVETRVTRFEASGPFGASQDSFEQPFTLRREEGEWRLVEVKWPYYGCGKPRYFPAEPAIAPAPAPARTPTATSTPMVEAESQ